MRGPRRVLPALLAVLTAGCAVGPDYVRPSAPLSPTFKEAAGWVVAAPADELDRGDWWRLFNDPVLDDLERRVEVSNQNIAQAEAAYRQATLLVREQESTFFPTLTLSPGVTRSRSGAAGRSVVDPTTGQTISTGTGGATNIYRVNASATWAPDVWGRVRRTVEGAQASAQASAGDLAAAKLSVQGALAVDYLNLRLFDATLQMDAATVAAYERTLQITQNLYNAGISPHSDVLQAQTQLDNARADMAAVERQRATFEHAIAILTGEAPGNFTLPPAAWTPVVPQVPVGLPSTLLQRRPDVAAAERRMASANAQIGVATAAFFPTLTLTATDSYSSTVLSSLFKQTSNFWSTGFTLAQTLFDAGARRARLGETRAFYDQTVAFYRESVLLALQSVEDNLTATRSLEQQYALRQAASIAADQAEQMVLNRYRAGLVSYTTVITAQTSAYSARLAYLQAAAARQTTAVALIQALGGGWKAPPS